MADVKDFIYPSNQYSDYGCLQKESFSWSHAGHMVYDVDVMQHVFIPRFRSFNSVCVPLL